MENQRGLLGSILGPDKAGKGTQWALLGYALGKMGYDVYMIPFPNYGTLGGFLVEVYLRREQIKKELDLEFEMDMPREVGSLLYTLDRAYHIKLINEALEEGKIVFTKRGSAMTHAVYQSELNGLDFDQVKNTESFFPTYDFSVMLDLPQTVVDERMKKFKKHANNGEEYIPDENEKKSQDGIVEKWRDLHTAEENPLGIKYRKIVDASSSIENVFRAALKEVLEILDDAEVKKGSGEIMTFGREEPVDLQSSLGIFQTVAGFHFDDLLELKMCNKGVNNKYECNLDGRKVNSLGEIMGPVEHLTECQEMVDRVLEEYK